MAKSKDSFNKQEAEKRKEKKRKEKEQRKEERKAANAKAGNKSFEDMLAYVDEDGNITSTPPDPTKKKVIREEDIQISVRKQDPNQQADPLRRGRVTFFNDSKGYGFIRDQNTQESIFVHVNSVDGQIRENDKVTFQVEMGPKGLNAVDVKVVN